MLVLDDINSVAKQIAQKDIEAYTLLESILGRPKKYVGVDRLDYIDHMFGGYCLGRDIAIDYMPSKELQHWLLHTQSASLQGALSGRTLFYRCYGFRQQALNQYIRFLSASIQRCLDHDREYAIDEELRSYEDNNQIIKYDCEDGNIEDHKNRLAHAVIQSIEKQLRVCKIDYDDILVYVRKERLFCQVRFLYHSKDGWVDDSSIISMKESHEHLIALHANARNTTTEALCNCGCQVYDSIGYDDNQLSRDSFFETISFNVEFNQWKQELFRD